MKIVDACSSTLQICRELLKNSGSIYIRCKPSEYPHVKILMDIIFGSLKLRVLSIQRLNEIKFDMSSDIIGWDQECRYILGYSKTNKYICTYFKQKGNIIDKIIQGASKEKDTLFCPNFRDKGRFLIKARQLNRRAYGYCDSYLHFKLSNKRWKSINSGKEISPISIYGDISKLIELISNNKEKRPKPDLIYWDISQSVDTDNYIFN